jgi:hypothetical protein
MMSLRKGAALPKVFFPLLSLPPQHKALVFAEIIFAEGLPYVVDIDGSKGKVKQQLDSSSVVISVLPLRKQAA